MLANASRPHGKPPNGSRSRAHSWSPTGRRPTAASRAAGGRAPSAAPSGAKKQRLDQRQAHHGVPADDVQPLQQPEEEGQAEGEAGPGALAGRRPRISSAEARRPRPATAARRRTAGRRASSARPLSTARPCAVRSRRASAASRRLRVGRPASRPPPAARLSAGGPRWARPAARRCRLRRRARRGSRARERPARCRGRRRPRRVAGAEAGWCRARAKVAAFLQVVRWCRDRTTRRGTAERGRKAVDERSPGGRLDDGIPVAANARTVDAGIRGLPRRGPLERHRGTARVPRLRAADRADPGGARTPFGPTWDPLAAGRPRAVVY